MQSVCPAATPGHAECLALLRTDSAARPASAISPQATTGYAYGPPDIESAYSLPTSQGSGMTVAVVDYTDLSTAEQDLASYRSYYHLPSCTTANGCFRRVDEYGGTAYPTSQDPSGWGLEIALDLDMVSAACPNCDILLVEAYTSDLDDLGRAVDTAVSLGAVAVSNSYGGREVSGAVEGNLDADYYNHPGVAITASTGDCGWNCTGTFRGTVNSSVQYPAASPYVVAVGGTSLTGSPSAGWSESAWGDSDGGAGSGCSLYESKPSWQQDTGCGSYRTQADVSAVADPLTGVWIYDSSYSSGHPWQVEGGTSAASPIIAATFALAGGPGEGTYAASDLYGHPAGLNDVVGGNNDVTWGTCKVPYLCNGVVGYDGPTGLGTPHGTAAFSESGSQTTYHAITPTRLLDTRNGTGGLSGPFSSHVARTFQVTGGTSGVPSNATAVTGNLTVTGQTSAGYLYIGPVAMNNPTSSTLNFPAGDDRANNVSVALGTGGNLSITFVAPAPGPSAHAIFDVTGYFTPDMTGSTYHAVTPARLLDSRNGTGGISGPVSSHAARSFAVTDTGVVPTGATAVTGNLTVTGQTSNGYLFIGPVAMNNPTSSTLNFPRGDDRANGLTVALGTGGVLWVTFVAPSPGNGAYVIFDVTGYFTGDASGDTYVPLSPGRILDTRSGAGGLSGPFSSHAARTFTVVGVDGVPAGATAVTGNLTVTGETSNGYLFIGPVATNDPTSSTLNFPAGDDQANGVAVALGSGSLSITFVAPTPGQSAYAIFDVTGYFAP